MSISREFLVSAELSRWSTTSMGILDTSGEMIEVGGVWTDNRIELSLSLPDILDGIGEIEGFPTCEDTIFLEVELGTSVSSDRTQKPPPFPSKLARCCCKLDVIIQGLFLSCLFIRHSEYDSESTCIAGMISYDHYFYPIGWFIISFPGKQALWGSILGPKQGFETKYIQDYGVVSDGVSGEAVKIRHKIDVKGEGYM